MNSAVQWLIMSRHRNIRHMVAEEAEDEDDFGPEEEPEDPIDDLEDLVKQVQDLSGSAFSRNDIVIVLEETNYDITETLKLLEKRKKKTKASSKPSPKPILEEEKKEFTRIPDSPVQHETPEQAKLRLNQEYPSQFPAFDQQSTKPSISIVVIGHVDSGKSTLMGHLLAKMGAVDQRTIQKFERESRDVGKAGFHYAWVLDASEEERKRGVTIDVGYRCFSTANRDITLLDAPGHQDFVPKMISGAAQADAAVLVIDSTEGGFEAGFGEEGAIVHGQTKEHAFIARSLGITHLIVAINKLELSNWDEGRFDSIRFRLSPFLLRVGYREENVTYLPLSGLHGVNLIDRLGPGELSRWYSGPCLVELLDRVQPAFRDATKPLRVSVMDACKVAHGTTQGNVVSGRIEGGQIRIGDRVLILPSNVRGTVKTIEKGGESLAKASAGHNVDLSLKDIDGDFTLVLPGHTLCGETYPAPMLKRFLVKGITFDIAFPITKQQQLMLHSQSLKSPVTVVRILHTVDPATGAVLKERPRCLTKYMTAVIELEAADKVCLERFSNYKSLGRVTLRDRSETVMSGMVTELLS